MARRPGPGGPRASAHPGGRRETGRRLGFVPASGQEGLIRDRFTREEEPVPLGRPAAPEEIAGAAARPLSDRSSFVTGTVLPVDGGARPDRATA
ncbi:SDR family oxidoreductase [Streptomyces sp. NPDC003703]|uniref:SDR family oxidoreductase n=1 Tax=Streptomyces sp. NPDC003283 TaxID=3364681 RepID=UPI0036771A94